MSWAKDEWKADLTSQALNKVSEYEENLERSRKELQQRQFQLDSLSAALQKQKLLTEEEKNLSNQYKRDLQLVSKKYDECEKTRMKMMTDMQMKDSKINGLNDKLLKEKQVLDNEVSLNNRLKLDLDTNITKYNNLLSDFQRQQKETEVQQRKAPSDGEGSRNSSYRTSSGSDTEQEVFPVQFSRKYLHAQKENIAVKTQSISSTSSTEENTHINQEAIIKELQNTIDCFKKERGILREKCESTITELDICQSKLVTMENKNKQLLQQIECQQHNSEAAQRHQAERMKEKEQEYRDEISTQSKALVQLEQELKEMKLKLAQDHSCSNVKMRELEMAMKKTQKENVAAHETIAQLELAKKQQSTLVENSEKSIAELRQELEHVKQGREVAMISQQESMKTIEELNQHLETNNLELKESKRLIIKLEESRESVIVEERNKFLGQIKFQENERDNVVAKFDGLEKFLEESSLSNTEKQHNLKVQVDDLRLLTEKSRAVVEEKERELINLQVSLDEKDKMLREMAELLEKCSDPKELKKLSEEVFLLQGKLESSTKLCESLKQKVKDSEIMASHSEAQLQMMQMDLEDKEELIQTLQEQKRMVEFNYQENLQRLSEYNGNLSTANNEVDNLKIKIDGLEEKAKEKESQGKQLGEELTQIKNALECSISRTTNLIEELKKTREERDERCTSYETKIEELEKTLNETKTAQVIAEKAVVGELKAELAKTNGILAAKKDELSEANLQLRSMDEEFNKTQTKLIKAEKDLECLNTNMSMIVTDKSNIMSDLKKLEQELDEKIELLSKQQAELLEKDQVINSLKVDNNEILEKKHTDLQSTECKIKELTEACTTKTLELKNECEKLEEVTMENDRLQKSIGRLRAEASEKALERQKCVDQRKEVEMSCVEYKTTISQLETKLSDALEMAQKERLLFEEKFCQLSKDLMLCKETIQEKNNVMEEIKNNLACLQSEKESLALECERLQMASTSSLQQFEEAKSQCEEYFKKLSEQEKVSEEYKFNCGQVTSELAITKELSESIQNKLSEELISLTKTMDNRKEELWNVKEELEKQLTCVLDTKTENKRLQALLETMKLEKDSISDKYENVLLENKIFTKKLAASEQEKIDRKNEADHLQKEIESIQSKDESGQQMLHENIKHLKKELDEKKKEIGPMENELKQKVIEIKLLADEKESLQFQIENLNKEKKANLEKLENIQSKHEFFVEKLTSSEQDINKLNVVVAELNDELNKTKEEGESVKITLDKKERVLRDALTKTEDILRTTKNDLVEKETALQVMMTEQQTLLFEIENMKGNEKINIEKLERCVNESKLCNEKLVAREQQITEQNLRVELLQKEVLDAKSVMETSQATVVDNARKLQEDLHKEKKKLETTINTLKEKDAIIAMMNTEKETLLLQVESISKEKNKSVEKFELIINENMNYVEKLNACEEQMKKNNMVEENLKEELSELKKERENTQTVNDKTINHLRDELTRANEMLAKTTDQLKETEITVHVLTGNKESLVFDLESVNNEKKDAMEKVERYTLENKMALEKLSICEKQLAEFKLIVEQSQAELSTLTNFNEELESQQLHLNNTLMVIKDELKSEKENLEKTSSDLEQSKTLVSTLNVEKEDLNAEIEELKSRNSLISENLDNVKRQSTMYESNIGEIDKLTSNYKIKESQCQELEEQLRCKEIEFGETLAKAEDTKAIAANEIADLKRVIENKDYILGENSYELNQLKTTIEAQMDQIKEYELKCKTQQEKGVQKVAELERLIEQLRHDGELKEKEKSDAVELVESLHYQLNTKVNEAGLIEKEFEKERDEMVERIKTAARDLEEIQRNVESKKEKIVLLEKQLVESDCSKDREHYEEILAIKEENEKLHERINCISIENDELKREMRSIQGNLENQLSIKDERLAQLDCQLDNIRDEQINVKKENMKKVKNLENELLKEREKVTSSCKRIDELLLNKRDECDAKANAARDFKRVREELEGKIKTLLEQLEKQERLLEEFQIKTQENEIALNDIDKTKVALEKSNQLVTSLKDSLKEATSENKVLKNDYEQLKQKEIHGTLNESSPIVYEEADSVKVSELEFCVMELRKKVVEQEEKNDFMEKSLKCTVEEKGDIHIKLNETLKENVDLREKLEQNMNKITNLAEEVARLEKRLTSEENDKEFIQTESLNELKEKTNEVQVLLNEKTTSLISKEQETKKLIEELDIAKQLANKSKTTVDELEIELQQAKNLLQSATYDFKLMETLKEEMQKVEEKCAMWRSRCSDCEVTLQNERCSFDKEKQSLEKENGRLINSYKETKYQLQQSEDESKAMADRLLHLEGKMIMMPDIENLKKELEILKKELENEKENATKYEKLSKQYFQKLNEMDVSESAIPANVTSNSKNILFDNGMAMKDQESLKQELPLNKELQVTTASTPTLMEEVEIFLSPIKQSKSNFGFLTPGQGKTEITKPTRLAKPKINRKVPRAVGNLNIQNKNTAGTSDALDGGSTQKRADSKDMFGDRLTEPTIVANKVVKPAVTSKAQHIHVDDAGASDVLPVSNNIKKRKDEGDTEGIKVSKAKRAKIVSPLHHHEIITRSKTSIQSRLPQPKTRSQLHDSRSRIPRRTIGKSAPEKGTGIMSQIPKSKSSEDECKMQ